MPRFSPTDCVLPVVFLCLLAAYPKSVHSQAAGYPPRFEGSQERTYKSVGDVDLKLWIFTPEGHQPTDRRPAVVFFFGGGWKSGNPSQFEHHCRYLASRGMVAVTADYRVLSRHQTLADRSVADAKSAVRWLRSHAKELGIDPERIAAGGGSAGGHLAACTATIADLDEPHEDASVSSIPNALVLFNPALLLASYDDVTVGEEKQADLAARTGVAAERISPIHHVRAGLPPTIIFHGIDDPTVAYRTVEKYREVAQAAGNLVDLHGYEKQVHGFFNYGRGGTPGEYYLRTVHAMDRFLASLGYLDGEPTFQVPESRHVRVRDGLSHLRRAIEQDKRATIAFIGGSITEMEGYRPMIMQFFKDAHPAADFAFVNAGISSTCSTTGAYRLGQDVLAHQPDLVFVEFAVNDDQDAVHASRECLRGMEGIVRHIQSKHPKTDIVITHFVNPSMLEQLRAGVTPVSIAAHERVADHYRVSSVNVAAELADRMDAGSFSWETYGGTHPKQPGNRLAADLNIECLRSAASMHDGNNQVTQRRVPKPIDPHSYFRGKLVAVTAADIDKTWQVVVPNWSELPGMCRGRFTQERLLCADQPGAEMTISFRGTAIGAYVLAGPDAGVVEVSIDGGPFQKHVLYHHHSKNLHYPRTVIFDADRMPGEHTLVLRIAKQTHPESSGHAARILSFVVNES